MSGNHGAFTVPRIATQVAALICVVGLAGCLKDGGSSSSAGQTLLSCDDSMKSAFKPDANTSVQLVKAFKRGDPLPAGAANSSTPTAPNDMCQVKLLVGPGNPGPAGAPSTSPGISIEVWLPTASNWNHRLHVVGGFGWAGSTEVSTNGTPDLAFVPASIAGIEGAVSASTDTGHEDPSFLSGSFAMNPDGTINQTLWADFSYRAIHEMAVKSKALAAAYYGSAPRYSYWDGGSGGGRQGLKEAQVNPQDFDGILAAYPGINWSQFITADLYPQIVFQRDLGGAPLSQGQMDLVSNAAINACDLVGGQHLGYILDPSQCTYDPTQDTTVLCTGSGGSNTTANCVSTVQAQAINKIWYGMTSNGSAPSPATDRGWGISPSGTQRWYGLARGTSLYASFFVKFLGTKGVASDTGEAFSMASQMVALESQDPRLADAPAFRNASASSLSNWRSLSYAQLSNAFDLGLSLQTAFANINTDNPDLSAFKNRGGKLLSYHGLADELIPPQGTINYYNRVLTQLGGLSAAQSFFRLYLVPGLGHGSPNGTSNPQALPPVPAPGQFYSLLTNWVENGVAPDKVDLTNSATLSMLGLPNSLAVSQPVCPYPKKATYQSGNPLVAESYSCS